MLLNTQTAQEEIHIALERFLRTLRIRAWGEYPAECIGEEHSQEHRRHNLCVERHGRETIVPQSTEVLLQLLQRFLGRRVLGNDLRMLGHLGHAGAHERPHLEQVVVVLARPREQLGAGTLGDFGQVGEGRCQVLTGNCLLEQLVLRPEVAEERDFIHPRLLRYSAGGGATETDFSEDGDGGPEDFFAYVHRAGSVTERYAVSKYVLASTGRWA